MTTPRTKRPFAGAAADPAQRQLTDFFSHSVNSASEDNTTIILPASVQANLLSVGMRVRKSVPEGYKTGSGSGGLGHIFTDTRTPAQVKVTAADTNIAAPNNTTNLRTAFSVTKAGRAGQPKTKSITHKQTQVQMYNKEEKWQGDKKAVTTMTRRELLPFCGINKVGGLAFPDEMIAAENNKTEIDDDILVEMPGLSSSQDTLPASSQEIPSSIEFADRNLRKRYYVEKEAEDEEKHLKQEKEKYVAIAGMGWSDGFFSSEAFNGEEEEDTATTMMIEHDMATIPDNPGRGRVMAIPRRFKKDLDTQQRKTKDNSGDFPEADFLNEYRMLE